MDTHIQYFSRGMSITLVLFYTRNQPSLKNTVNVVVVKIKVIGHFGWSYLGRSVDKPNVIRKRAAATRPLPTLSVATRYYCHVLLERNTG